MSWWFSWCRVKWIRNQDEWILCNCFEQEIAPWYYILSKFWQFLIWCCGITTVCTQKISEGKRRHLQTSNCQFSRSAILVFPETVTVPIKWDINFSFCSYCWNIQLQDFCQRSVFTCKSIYPNATTRDITLSYHYGEDKISWHVCLRTVEHNGYGGNQYNCVFCSWRICLWNAWLHWCIYED